MRTASDCACAAAARGREMLVRKTRGREMLVRKTRGRGARGGKCFRPALHGCPVLWAPMGVPRAPAAPPRRVRARGGSVLSTAAAPPRRVRARGGSVLSTAAARAPRALHSHMPHWSTGRPGLGVLERSRTPRRQPRRTRRGTCRCAPELRDAPPRAPRGARAPRASRGRRTLREGRGVSD